MPPPATTYLTMPAVEFISGFDYPHPEVEKLHLAIQHIFDDKTKRTAQACY
jgi:hypothetical protein